MRVSLLASITSALLLTTAAFAQGEGEYPATLKGHAVLPAESFVDAPADAPADLKTAGKYTTGKRVDAPGTVMGKSYERPTGVSLPFKGQPLQGHSGVKSMGNGEFWVLTDNGMGSRYNSANSMLYLNRHKIDWASGKIERQETVFLHDPDRKVPFRIVHEDTARRYLTGADFDTEGFQIVGDTFWIGDEFGPYVLKADKTGKILAVFDTMADGKPVRSPDHWSVQSPAAPGASYTTVNLRRSKGYEGFAGSKDGKFLYGLLEGPLWDADKKDFEKVDGKEAARILEFDVAAEKFTGRYWHYVFEQNGHAIGDFNMIDGTIRPDHRARQWRRHRRQGLSARRTRRELLSRPRQVQAHLQDRSVRRQCRQTRAQGRLYRPDEDQGPGEEGKEAAQRRRAHLPLLHHRERRSCRRDAHHRRQRQQSAVLLQPRSQQGRRQRVRVAGSGEFLKAK